MEQNPRPRVTERVAQTAHETIDRLQEKAARVEDQLRDTAERARESGEKATHEVQGTVEKITGYIEKNPLQSAAIAFAAGLLVSSLLRR